jgi:hypothetical protein
MTGRELSRHVRDDGMAEVRVALGADRQGTLIVPASLLDSPGYQGMLDAYVAKHAGLLRLREGEAIA